MTTSSHLEIELSPQGQLRFALRSDSPDPTYRLDTALQDRLTNSFAQGAGHGLLQLGCAEIGQPMPAALAWWRDFASQFATRRCAVADDESISSIAAPDDSLLAQWLSDMPPMRGAEYADAAVLARLWSDLNDTLHVELAASKKTSVTF